MKIKAAVLYDVNTPLKIEEIDLADPKPGEVRVKIDSVGLCQTDCPLYERCYALSYSDSARSRRSRDSGCE